MLSTFNQAFQKMKNNFNRWDFREDWAGVQERTTTSGAKRAIREDRANPGKVIHRAIICYSSS